MGKVINMGMDKVSVEKFYMDDGDKNKQNWFLYEYANILYSKIEENPKLEHYRKKHNEESISEFCVYFSKRLRESIFNRSTGKVDGIVIDARYVYEFYPDNSRVQTQRLLDAAVDAWKEHISVCMSCPNRCIEHGFKPTNMFDNLKETGWPTKH